MPWMLRSLRWWIGHVLVVFLCVTFVNLGFWQLRRAEERRLENDVLAVRFASEALPIGDLVDGAGPDIESLLLRRAWAEGEFQPQYEVLVRSQVNEGTAGFHVVTPLLLEDGRALMVNRGWIPLELDDLPSPVRPPGGKVVVEGWLQLGQPSSSAEAGDDGSVRTVDLVRLQEGVPWPLYDVYLIDEDGGGAGTLPVPVPPPDLTDRGPHLLYAWQWFAFAATGAAGYVFLLRRALKGSPANGRTRPLDQ